jgi:superfamily II DNA/RNA helicase
MLDYAERLLSAINAYDEKNEQSVNSLRDLVCIISDNTDLKNDPIIKSLLYMASQKMRVFGYNTLNRFIEDPNMNSSGLTLLSNASILQSYRSKVFQNNFLDKTQKEIIDFYQSLSKKRMLVSAPTSYGKTFIMREILFLNQERYQNVLLVFPTVALLRENATAMENLTRDLNMGYRVIKSVDSEIDPDDRNIFVFTPERAMQLLATYENLKIDFFFYDEMYKIDEDYNIDETVEVSDDDEEKSKSEQKKKASRRKTSFLDESRAKAFRICLYLLSKQVPEYYLAAPNLDKEQMGDGFDRFIFRNHIHIKFIDFEPTIRIRVDAFDKSIIEQNTNLPIMYLPERKEIIATTQKDRLCSVVEYIDVNHYGQTLVYCQSPAKASRKASELSERQNAKKIIDVKYRLFLNHIEKKYDISGSSANWSFLKVLKSGFAMHHGKLPKYIQKEVLNLFNKGVFDLMFCTTTITEGVNTYAKNMVLLNSKKGQNTPLTFFDVKNIIGRAGRYYHNFIGRFFITDKNIVPLLDPKAISIDFATYGEKALDAVDLDNAFFEDLTTVNTKSKQQRLEIQHNYKLPDKVFEKNRLIKKEVQEALLQRLITSDEDFFSLLQKMRNTDLIETFRTFNALKFILQVFENAKIINKSIVTLYSGISYGYLDKGFGGILSYQLKNASEKGKTIDSAYSNAFSTQKDIIEYKIPKLLALFESIFVCAAEIRNKPINNFSLSKIIRYYETGVLSYFGEQLIEFGFPVDTIREIEKKCPVLKTCGLDETKRYITNRINHDKVLSILDDYEKGLFEEALKSIM